MGTLVEPKDSTMIYTPRGFIPYGDLISAGMAYQDVKAIMDGQASDALLSQLEDAVPSNVEFSVADYLKGIDASDGISQQETDLAYMLLKEGLVSAEDIEAATNIPASNIQNTYDAISLATEAAEKQKVFNSAEDKYLTAVEDLKGLNQSRSIGQDNEAFS